MATTVYERELCCSDSLPSFRGLLPFSSRTQALYRVCKNNAAQYSLGTGQNAIKVNNSLVLPPK